MKIPDEKKESFTYMRWKEMDLLNASDVERVLMLNLDSVVSFSELTHNEKLWNRTDMREFVRFVSRKIEKELSANRD